MKVGAACLHEAQFAALTLMAVAWPWEMYQRVPGTGFTLVKLSGIVFIVLVLIGVIIRRQPLPRTGLVGPILLLGLGCLLSWPRSLDPAATSNFLQTYATYLVLLYAVAGAVRTRSEAVFLLRAFSASAMLVACLAWANAAGWAAPAYLSMTRQTGRLVTQSLRQGADLRMAAASPDANQGILPLLLALPIVLWLWPGRGCKWGMALRAAAAMALVGALFIAVSRSALVLAVIVIGAYAVSKARRQRLSRGWLITGAVAVGLALVAASPYLYAVADRTFRGLTGGDASAADRMLVYREAVRLVPQYALMGTGLGASDLAIYRGLDSARTGGLTLHSVPFKFLLETGVLGLAGCLWLFARILRRTGREALAAGAERAAWGRALLLMWVAIIGMTLVQPFMQLSLFPLTLGLTMGPLAAKEAPSNASGPLWVRYAALPLLAMAPANFFAYQEVVAQVSEQTETLHRGYVSEQAGLWQDALRHYASVTVDSKAGEHRYYAEAADVAQLPFLLEELNAGCSSAVGIAPLAHYLKGRVEMLVDAKRPPEGLRDAVRVRAAFADAWRLLGDVHWRLPNGQAKAIACYAEAAAHAAAPVNAPHARMRTKMAEQARALASANRRPSELVAAANIYRRLGDWPRCVGLAEEAYTAGDSPEACFLLAVEAGLRGDAVRHRALLEEALAIEPRHLAAAQALTGE